MIPAAAILLAIGAAAAWALGMTAAKPILRSMDRLSYMLGRWALAGVLSLAYGLLTGELSIPGWEAVGWAALAGVLDATIGGFFYVMAMIRTSAYQTTTLSSTTPLWGVLASILFLGEPARWSVFVAGALVVAGAYLLMGRRSLNLENAVSGSLFALLTGLLWGVAETVPSKLALDAGLSPAALLSIFSVSGVAGIALLLPMLRVRIPRRIERKGIGLMIGATVAGLFLGWLLWLHGLERAPASVLAPVRGSTMVFALLYSMVFLRERPTRRAFSGVFLVLSGVLLVSFGS